MKILLGGNDYLYRGDIAGGSFLQFREEEDDYYGQGHRRNMLSDGYNMYACAIIKYKDRYYTVQEFGNSKTVGTPIVEKNGKETAIIPINNGYLFNGYYYLANVVILRAGKELPLDRFGFAHFKDSLGDTISSYFAPYAKVESNDVVEIKDGHIIVAKKLGSLQGSIGKSELMIDSFKKTFQVIEVKPVPMYRVYNPNNLEHFYTKDKNERVHLVELGWHDEGIAWNAPHISNTPVLRLYNPNNGGEHHFTTDRSEAQHLEDLGWKFEGLGWYSEDYEEVKLFRLYNPTVIANNHHYTADLNEKNTLVSWGWIYEGDAWFGMK